MIGDPSIQHLINIHFFSNQLGQMAASRPGMLYFIFNAQVVMVLVAHNLIHGEFVAQVCIHHYLLYNASHPLKQSCLAKKPIQMIPPPDHPMSGSTFPIQVIPPSVRCHSSRLCSQVTSLMRSFAYH